jgi:predicted nucleotidyltransferase
VLDLTRADPSLLHLIDGVVTELLTRSNLLNPSEVLLVGAHCRDILRNALGHEFALRITSDIDLGLAMANWAAYDELVAMLPPAGNTGIRFRVADATADPMPFGALEDPPGTVTPASRQEPISVWGFAEVFAAALPLMLPTAGSIQIPTVAGYAALKLAAWLDRSAYGEYKDAADIATVLYWYSKSPDIETRIYETSYGQEILVQEDLDAAAAARILGEDILAVLGAERLAEIAVRWPLSPKDLLTHHMAVPNAPAWPGTPGRRLELTLAMERGLGIS